MSLVLIVAVRGDPFRFICQETGINNLMKSKPLTRNNNPGASNRAADLARRRCEVFAFAKFLKKLPRKPMSYAVLQQLGLISSAGD